ncbi:MAG: ParA family protein [Candidatus Sumerlaeota bacterium]|nr:ParA family protein [Candidatus Sumerlaeota bacterium]
MTHVVAIANQKGGVGKTTTAVNLSACLASTHHRTLLIDMDPQANATSGLGIDKQTLPMTIYDLLIGSPEPPERVFLNPIIKDLWLLPSNIHTIGAESELLGASDKERRLRHIVHNIRDRFDYIIIDAPPSLGLLAINVLTAADWLLIPVQCEYYALEGLSLLMETVRRVRSAFNPELKILGLLLTMFDSRTNLARQVTEDVRRHFGSSVFNSIIARTVKLSEAPSFGTPITLYDPNSTGARCHIQFCEEFLSRLEEKTRTTNVGISPPRTQGEILPQEVAQ